MATTTVYQGGKPAFNYDSATGTSSPVPNNATQATEASDAQRASGQVAAQMKSGTLPTNVDGGTAGASTIPANPNPPATSTNTPVNTNTPNPSNVNATPYTGGTTNPTVSAAEAQANLAKGGLTGSDLASAQSALSTFQQGHAATQASGIPAPQSAGVGMSDATQTAGSTTQAYAPPPQVQDAVAKATQQYTDDFAKAMTSQSQGETLVQQYQDFSKQLGIPEINTELINMNNVINGTEDDIRNEITKAGGFATDSQVLAMTNARNKTMIQNYNTLVQTKTDAMQQLSTLSGLAAQDRQFAADQIDKQLNFDQQQITFATNAQTNAQNSIQKSIDTYGAASVLKQAQMNSDPTTIARINATMGNGFDLATAAAHPTLDQQVKEANIAQSYAAAAASNRSNQISSGGLGGGTGSYGAALTPYINQTSGGTKYFDASALQGTASQKTALINQATAAGLKVITNKNTAADLVNMTDAKNKLQTIQGVMANIAQPSWLERDLGGLGLTKLAAMAQSDPRKAAAGSLSAIGLDVLKAISGVQGFRGNQTAVQQVTDHLPKITDTQDVVNQKVDYINQLINDRENAALGTSGNANAAAPQPLLAPTQIPTGMYQASDGLLYKK
jgi:hypothetical protein